MADNFGLKIGVEGEKEFKKSLSEINQSFKVLGSEMKLVESEFGKNENSIESLTAKNEVLNKQIDSQRDKIETLRKALENASTSFGENDRRTQNWAVQLNNAQAELNGMERELKGNEKALDQVADEFNDAEQIRLRDFCHKLDALSHTWILSNSDVKGKDINDNFFDDLYSDFTIQRVDARRSINANPEKRGSLKELLITNQTNSKEYVRAI